MYIVKFDDFPDDERQAFYQDTRHDRESYLHWRSVLEPFEMAQARGNEQTRPRTADAKADKAKVSAEIAELDQHIARLRPRLKAGDPDMSADDIAAVIDKVESRKAELMAAQPEAKHQAKLLPALPAPAKQYRDQITKGFSGNVNCGRPRQGGGAPAAGRPNYPQTGQGSQPPGSAPAIQPCGPAGRSI